MGKWVLSAALLVASTAFGDVNSALADLQSYLETTNPPVVAEVETKAQLVEDEAGKVLADTNRSEDDKQKALFAWVSAYVVSVRVDVPRFQPKLEKATSEAVKLYPGGQAAAYGDITQIILQLGKLTVKEFLGQMEIYAATYPKYLYGPILLMQYTEIYAAVDLTVAKSINAESLKFYPNNEILTTILRGLNRVGQPVELTGPAINGTNFDIKAWRGRVVVIDFWATWCGPCKALTPDLKQFYADMNHKGVEVVGFSLDNDIQSLKDYVSQKSIQWPQIYHPNQVDRSKISREFGVVGIPTLFVVDKDGNQMGYGAHDLASVKKLVNEALAK